MRDCAGRIHDTIMSLELIDLEGQPCILSLVHEVTELKRLNDRLRRVQKMEALGRLAGGIAHDFNNILTAILGYTALVLDALPRRLATTTSASATSSAPRRARRRSRSNCSCSGASGCSRPEVIDLNAHACATSLPMLQRLIDEDVVLRDHARPDAGAVEIDPAQLEQVILNLTLNARDAMPQRRAAAHRRRGRADARADGAPAGAPHASTDDGVGMDEDDARAHLRAVLHDQGGRQRHRARAGDRATASSSRRAGRSSSRASRNAARASTCSCRARSGRGRPAPPPREVVRQRGAGETLLVVEDDESVCEFVSFVLRARRLRHPRRRRRRRRGSRRRRAPGDASICCSPTSSCPIATDARWPTSCAQTNPRLRVMYMSGYPGDTLQRYEGIPPGDCFLAEAVYPRGAVREGRRRAAHLPRRQIAGARSPPCRSRLRAGLGRRARSALMQPAQQRQEVRGDPVSARRARRAARRW